MIRDSWALVLAATLLALGGAWLATVFVAPTYTATSMVFVSAPGPSSPRAALDGNRSSLARVESYAELTTSEQVLRRTIVQLHLSMEPEELKKDVLVLPTPGSASIEVAVTADTGDTARDIANALATNLIQVIEEIDLGSDGPVSTVTLVDPAVVPGSPSTPKQTDNLLLGGGMGFVVSCVLVVVYGVRRDTIQYRDQAEYITGRAAAGRSGGDRR